MIGNLNKLESITSANIFLEKDIYSSGKKLWDLFFSYPPDVPWLAALLRPLEMVPITPYLIVAGLSLFLFKDLRKYNSVGLLSGVFFILGLAVWVKYFAYDFRNSIWIKSFFIIFLSINLNYLYTKYLQKQTNKAIVFVFILLACITYLLALGDDFASKKQQQFQQEIANPEIAKTLAKLLKNKEECVLIYSNWSPLAYNYYSTTIKNRFRHRGVGNSKRMLIILNHKCVDGRYIVIRPEEKRGKDWNNILKLKNAGTIKQVEDESFLIYFVPPLLDKNKKNFNNRHKKNQPLRD